jgi:hypothetical protein
MRRTLIWLDVACVLLAIIAVVAYLGPASRSATATPAASLSITGGSDVRTPLQSEAPAPPPSIGLPSGVATAIPSELATLTARPKVTPAPSPASHLVLAVVEAKGWATWQPGSALWASPGAIVRGWHVGHVRVCAGSRCIDVLLDGWCACGERHGSPTLLDLSAAAFERLAPLSVGVIHVEVIAQ